MKNSNVSLEEMARELEDSGLYRVYRRINLNLNMVPSDGSQLRTGMFLDIESTGLDVLSCEPIEIAIIPFDYRSDGGIVSVHPPFHQLNEPSIPIPKEVTAITGITNEMVAGKRIDVDALEKFIEGAVVIIAHNASFDRPVAEKISERFREKAWACTMRDLDWTTFGFEGRKLRDLLAAYGLFFNAHRATDDCEAGISLLSQNLPNLGGRVLPAILDNARTTSWRVFAVDAPFECKDILRSRGYRWNYSNEVGPLAWWIDLKEESLNGEIKFLEEFIFDRPVNLPKIKITAFNRYSRQIS